MRHRPNPFACALLILGAGLSLGGLGSDAAKDLITWPMTAITVAAGLTIVLSLASAAGRGARDRRHRAGARAR